MSLFHAIKSFYRTVKCHTVSYSWKSCMTITITITLLHSDPTNVGYMRNTQIYKYIINQLINYIIKQCAEFYLGFT